MIRAATHEDIPRLVSLGQQMHALSSFSAISYEPAKVAEQLARLIDGEGVVFVAERDGVTVGGLAGVVCEYWFSRERIAVDYAFFIEPAQRHGITALKLIKAMEIWAKGRGAGAMQLGITTGLNVDALSKFYELAGYHNAGPIFKKEL